MKKLLVLDKTKATQLDQEIQQHRTRMSKINKKLAKDVAKWVDTALAGIGDEGNKNRNSNSSSNNNSGDSGDVDILEDEDIGSSDGV